MDEINETARTYNVPVIEDCAHAFGAEYRGRKVGNSSNVCTFSFHSVKPVPVCDAGAITTNNKLYHERLKKLRWLGIDKSTYVRSESGYGWEYNVEEVGYKYHGNDILAAIGRVGLRHVDEDNARRQEIVDMYREGLKDLLWLRFLPSVGYMEKNPHIKSANHLCIVRVPRKDEFINKLKEKGIDCGCHYCPNNHYEMYTHQSGDTKVTEELYKGIVSLPLHMKLTNANVKYIIKTIREVWN